MPYTFKLAHRLARLRRLALLAAAPAIVTACSNEPTDPLGSSQTTVATVEVNPSNLTENLGETLQFTAIVRDLQGHVLNDRTVLWSSSDTTIARIAGNGLGTAIGVGSARLTATVEGKSGVATTTIRQPTGGLPPGSVSDLAVTATTDNSVTLGFTETTNGAGQAATYLLRYAISPMNWGTAGVAKLGTCGTPVSGNALGSRRTCTVTGLSAATAYDFQLRAFRLASSQDTVFGALSNVGKGVTVATSAGTVVWPNEPGGSTELTNQPFDALEALGWHVTANPVGNMFIGSDLSAPQAGSRVLQFNYPSGFAGSVAPGTLYYPHAAYKEVYAGFYWKPSSPWQNHPTNVNKVAFWMTETSGSSLDLQMYGPAPYYMHVVTQFPGGTYRLPPNMTATPIELGKWHRIEWHVKYATNGNDGLVEWWMDGVLQGRYTNVQTPNDRGFIEYQFSPTWGGAGGVKTESDYFLYDQLKLSHR